MGDLLLIAIGIGICILFKKYDEGQKAKLKEARDKAEKAQAKANKKRGRDTEVDELRAQVVELTRIVREGKKSSE